MEDRLAALEARIRELESTPKPVGETEAHLAALEARIRELEASPRKPMKDSLRCPMCGGRTIYRSTSPVREQVLMCIATETSFMARYSTAPCGAHACAACGFTELHADFAKLELKKSDLQVLVGKEPEHPETPYR